MRKKPGFTLIELMIVVAIIAIIAAIAIPNLLRSRMSANEANAAAGVRTISTAEVQFQGSGVVIDSATGVGQYGELDDLGTAAPPFIDDALMSGTKSGYAFAVTPVADGSAPTYSATAQPVGANTGVKSYFVDETGVIRFSGVPGTPADENSLPLN